MVSGVGGGVPGLGASVCFVDGVAILWPGTWPYLTPYERCSYVGADSLVLRGMLTWVVVDGAAMYVVHDVLGGRWSATVYGLSGGADS